MTLAFWETRNYRIMNDQSCVFPGNDYGFVTICHSLHISVSQLVEWVDEIWKDVGKNEHLSSLLSLSVDSGHVRSFLQWPKLEVKYEKDNGDAYIF